MSRQKIMKSKYKKMQITLVLKALLVAVFGGGAGVFAICYLFSGVRNKVLAISIFFLVLVVITVYMSVSSMTKYLDEVVDGIDNVLEKRHESIVLIDELGPLERKLNELKIELEKQEKDIKNSESKKNDLILYLAHDLKTPLTSIIAYLNIVETHPDLEQEQRTKYVHVAYEKALRMHNLTEEFFEITKFHLRGIEVIKEKFDLGLMLEQIVDELYGVLDEKGMKCSVKTRGNLTLQADPNKIARVFDNIIRNAVAYSYLNTSVQIFAEEIGDKIEVIFRNRGNTISKDILDRLFEKFYRVDNSRSSSTGGAGLGLAVAKAIVDAHKGEISAYSANEIIEFKVILPKDIKA